MLGRVEFNLLKKFQEYCKMFNREERENAYTYYKHNVLKKKRQIYNVHVR